MLKQTAWVMKRMTFGCEILTVQKKNMTVHLS